MTCSLNCEVYGNDVGFTQEYYKKLVKKNHDQEHDGFLNYAEDSIADKIKNNQDDDADNIFELMEKSAKNVYYFASATYGYYKKLSVSMMDVTADRKIRLPKDISFEEFRAKLYRTLTDSNNIKPDVDLRNY